MTGTIIQTYTEDDLGRITWMVLDEGTIDDYVAWWVEYLIGVEPDDIDDHFEWAAKTKVFVEALVRAQVKTVVMEDENE